VLRRSADQVIARSRSVRVLIGAALLVVGLSSAAAAQPSGDTVIRLSLEGVVDPFVADYLRTEIEDAEGAAAVLITMDTPGGLDSAMREIVQAIQASSTPVIGYVSPSGARAASAGAFILMATHVAAMAPATNVGASTPVGIGGVTLSEKVEQDAAAYMRGLAEQRGRNAELASTFVTESKSISAEEALEGDVIDLIAPSEQALLDEVDGTVVATAEGNEVTLETEGATIT
jgi:membrane-bound serine protease (ClpP class)